MEKNKKRKIINYIVLVILILSLSIYYMMKNKKIIKKTNTKKITSIKKEAKNNKENDLVEKKEIRIPADHTDNRYVKKEVIRDIFQSIKKENTGKIEPPKQEKQIEIPFKIKGIFELGSEKSVILSTGEIVNEKETIKGFKILKIEEGGVILLDKLGRVHKIKIWGN